MLRRTVCLLLALFLVGPVAAGRIDAQTAAKLDRAVVEAMREDAAVGLAIGVIRDGQIVYLQGYGLADREREVRVSSGTLFRWASVSKPLTAIAAMQLAEQGKLSLVENVRTYVPEFPEKGALITPYRLLCHQGGIVHYTNGRVVRTKRSYPMEHPYQHIVLALDRFKESPLVCPPGSKFSYSTHGYMLLSAVVERAGEAPFAEQVRDRIARPLGMTTLQPDYQWVDLPGRAVGYRRKAGAIVTSRDADVSWKLGGGGFISNIEDLARFAEGLIDGRLVSRETTGQMWTPQRTADGTATGYGLGFVVTTQNGKLKISHTGGQDKTRVRMVIYPECRHGVVVMTNSEWIDPGRYSTLVYRELAGE